MIVAASLMLLLALINVVLNFTNPWTCLALFILMPFAIAVGILSLKKQRRDRQLSAQHGSPACRTDYMLIDLALSCHDRETVPFLIHSPPSSSLATTAPDSRGRPSFADGTG